MRATRLVVIFHSRLGAPVFPSASVASSRRIRSRPVPLYRPKLSVPETLKPFLAQVAPGGDAFPEEREAAELAARLDELGERLRKDASADASFLLAPAFRAAGFGLRGDHGRRIPRSASFERKGWRGRPWTRARSPGSSAASGGYREVTPPSS